MTQHGTWHMAKSAALYVILMTAGTLLVMLGMLGIGVLTAMAPATARSLNALIRAENKVVVLPLLAAMAILALLSDISVEVHAWGRTYLLSAIEMKLILLANSINASALLANPRPGLIRRLAQRLRTIRRLLPSRS